MGRTLGTDTNRAQVLGEDNMSLDKFYDVTLGQTGEIVAAAARWIDENVIDGVVMGVGSAVAAIGAGFRSTQTSFVRNYALAMALGAAVVIAYFVVR